MLFRAYRIARAIERAYPLGVFWLYVGLFLLTFALIFVFPPVAIVMVFAGLAGLLLAVAAGKALHLLANGLARALLSRGVCPACALRQLPDPQARPWQPVEELHRPAEHDHFRPGGVAGPRNIRNMPSVRLLARTKSVALIRPPSSSTGCWCCGQCGRCFLRSGLEAPVP